MKKQTLTYLDEDYDYHDDERGIYGRVIDGWVYYTVNEVYMDHAFGTHASYETSIDATDLQVTYYNKDGGEIFTEDFHPDDTYENKIYNEIQEDLS